MRLYIGILTGLGEDPAGADGGMRALVASLPLPAGTQVIVAAHGWDEASSNDLCQTIKQEIEAAMPDRVLLFGHSFGGGLAVFFTQWLWHWYGGKNQTVPELIHLFLFDPCPNCFAFGAGECVDPFGCYSNNDRRWFVPQTTVIDALVFFQRAGRPLGVKGVPLFERGDGTIRNVDVTDWTDPTLGHVDYPGVTGIIHDARVQAQVRETVELLLIAPALTRRRGDAATGRNGETAGSEKGGGR